MAFCPDGSLRELTAKFQRLFLYIETPFKPFMGLLSLVLKLFEWLVGHTSSWIYAHNCVSQRHAGSVGRGKKWGFDF